MDVCTLVGRLAALSPFCVFHLLLTSNPTLLWGANVKAALLIVHDYVSCPLQLELNSLPPAESHILEKEQTEDRGCAFSNLP